MLPAKLKHVAPPSAQGLVVRKAELTNATAFPLLAGSSNVFVDGSFVGSSAVPNASSQESVSLFFGPDDRLKVTRELVGRDTKGPEKFRQSTLVTYEYRIRIENVHDREADVELEDQSPLSRTDDVQVKFLGSSVEAVKADEKGILRWQLKPAAKSPVEVTFRYAVEHPLNRTVIYR